MLQPPGRVLRASDHHPDPRQHGRGGAPLNLDGGSVRAVVTRLFSQYSWVFVLLLIVLLVVEVSYLVSASGSDSVPAALQGPGTKAKRKTTSNLHSNYKRGRGKGRGRGGSTVDFDQDLDDLGKADMGEGGEGEGATRDRVRATSPPAITPTPIPDSELSRRFAYIVGAFDVENPVDDLWGVASLAMQLLNVGSTVPLFVQPHRGTPREHIEVWKSIPHVFVLGDIYRLNITGGQAWAQESLQRALLLNPPEPWGILKYVWLHRDMFIQRNIDELFGLYPFYAPNDRERGCEVAIKEGTINVRLALVSRDPPMLQRWVQQGGLEAGGKTLEQFFYQEFCAAEGCHPISLTYMRLPSDCVCPFDAFNRDGTKVFHFNFKAENKDNGVEDDPPPTDVVRALIKEKTGDTCRTVVNASYDRAVLPLLKGDVCIQYVYLQWIEALCQAADWTPTGREALGLDG